MSMNADLGTEEIFKHALITKGLINDDCPSIDLFNFDYFRERIALLKDSFPEDFFLHALALKASYLYQKDNFQVPKQFLLLDFHSEKKFKNWTILFHR